MPDSTSLLGGDSSSTNVSGKNTKSASRNNTSSTYLESQQGYIDKYNKSKSDSTSTGGSNMVDILNQQFKIDPKDYKELNSIIIPESPLTNITRVISDIELKPLIPVSETESLNGNIKKANNTLFKRILDGAGAEFADLLKFEEGIDSIDSYIKRIWNQLSYSAEFVETVKNIIDTELPKIKKEFETNPKLDKIMSNLNARAKDIKDALTDPLKHAESLMTYYQNLEDSMERALTSFGTPFMIIYAIFTKPITLMFFIYDYFLVKKMNRKLSENKNTENFTKTLQDAAHLLTQIGKDEGESLSCLFFDSKTKKGYGRIFGYQINNALDSISEDIKGVKNIEKSIRSDRESYKSMLQFFVASIDYGKDLSGTFKNDDSVSKALKISWHDISDPLDSTKKNRKYSWDFVENKPEELIPEEGAMYITKKDIQAVVRETISVNKSAQYDSDINNAVVAASESLKILQEDYYKGGLSSALGQKISREDINDFNNQINKSITDFERKIRVPAEDIIEINTQLDTIKIAKDSLDKEVKKSYKKIDDLGTIYKKAEQDLNFLYTALSKILVKDKDGNHIFKPPLNPESSETKSHIDSMNFIVTNITKYKTNPINKNIPIIEFANAYDRNPNKPMEHLFENTNPYNISVYRSFAEEIKSIVAKHKSKLDRIEEHINKTILPIVEKKSRTEAELYKDSAKTKRSILEETRRHPTPIGSRSLYLKKRDNLKKSKSSHRLPSSSFT